MLLGGTKYTKAVKKTATVPNKSVGTAGSLWMKSANARIALMRGAAATAYVFSSRAQSRAAVAKSQGKTTAVPLIARTTSASPDNVAGLNRPYIQVLSLGNDPGTQDVTKLKGKSNFYDTFILTAVNTVDAEKLDVVETFGNPHFFASGRFTKKVILSGVVRSQARTPAVTNSTDQYGSRIQNAAAFVNFMENAIPDYVVFRNFYEKYLRATLQAASNTFTRVFVDGDYYDGFVQNLSFNISAESEQTIPWSMSMLLMRSWNAADNEATSILQKFMDELKTERKPITDREALLELQDTKGEGKITVNGGASKTDDLRVYINGESPKYVSNMYLELKEANIGTLSADVPTELGQVVSLVDTSAEAKAINGATIKANEKMYVKLKVNNVAAMAEWAAKTSVTGSGIGGVEVTVYANGNKAKSAVLFFPVKVSGGDSLQISSATYTDPRSALELKASVDTASDPAVVTFDVPVEKQRQFYTETGGIQGTVALKVSGKAGNGVIVADTSKVKITNVSDVRAMTSSLAPSTESIDGKCSAFATGVIDPSGLTDPSKSVVSFEISSNNPAFAVATEAPINPFSSTEVVLYSLRGLYSVPGYEERAAEIRFVVHMPTPAALKGVITGLAEASVFIGAAKMYLDIKIPIADSAYVNGELPSPVKSRLEETVVSVEIKSYSQYSHTGSVRLQSKGGRTSLTLGKASYTSLGWEQSTIELGSGTILKDTPGYYMYRAPFTYRRGPASNPADVAPIDGASATITTNPFKKISK